MTSLEQAKATAALVSLENVTKYFSVSSRAFFRRGSGVVRALDGVSLRIGKGETYALVGESGSGKTTTARLVFLADTPTSGEVQAEGVPVGQFNRRQLRRYRASVSAVFQDPWSSLNPRMRVRKIIAEPLTTHRRLTKRAVRSEVAELLQVVGLHPAQAENFPHEFSGGQRQRIAIARALALRPKLIVLDEPVSALDVSFKAQIMNLLKALQLEHGMSYLLIAHDLATVRYMSHRVGVMYLGRIVEEGDCRELLSNPLHPYTRALVAASMSTRPGASWDDAVLGGEGTSLQGEISGCPFYPRCPVKFERCLRDDPALQEARPKHSVRCHLYDV